MLLVKKIIAYETTCVITVPSFWNINTQAMSRLVPVCQSYKVLRRTPPFVVLHMVWSCPQDTWRSPGQHLWPLFPLSALSSRTSLGFFWLWNRPLSTTVPKLHEHKAVFCSRSISLDAWGWGGGHGQGMALLCYLANNSKSFCSLKSPFS